MKVSAAVRTLKFVFSWLGVNAGRHGKSFLDITQNNPQMSQNTQIERKNRRNLHNLQMELPTLVSSDKAY